MAYSTHFNDLVLPSGTKLRLDGSSSGNTYISKAGAGAAITLTTNGVATGVFSGTSVSLRDTTISGFCSVSDISQDNSTYTGILVWDGGQLKYRTKAEIRSDIGAGTGSGTMTGFGVSNLASGQGTTFTITNGETVGILGGTNISSVVSTANETITLNCDITNNNQLTNGNLFITASSSDTLTNKGGSNSQWTNDENYITSASLPTVNNSLVTLNTADGLDGATTFNLNQATAKTINLSLDLNELAVGGTLIAGDSLVAVNGTTSNKQTISSIPLSIFNNDAGFTSNSGTMSSWNLTGDSGTSASVTNGSTVDIVGGAGIATTANGFNVSVDVDSSVIRTTGNFTLGGVITFSNTIFGSINGNAATVTNGVYTNTAQTITGVKTFNANLDIGDFNLRFGSTSGGLGDGILYKDSNGAYRNALTFEATNKVVLSNRATNGEIEFRANTSSAGVIGEQLVATVKDHGIVMTRPIVLNVSTADGIGSGTAVFSGGSSVTKGYIYYWTGSAWNIATQSNAYNRLVAMACGSGVSGTVGMMLQGMVNGSQSATSNGQAAYLTGSGQITVTVPTSDYARIMGYAISSTVFYFDPDKTWVDLN